MATSSQSTPLSTKMPTFQLRDVRTGEDVASDMLDGNALVVIFMCNHCPYVKRIAEGLARFGHDVAGSDVDVVGISANDADTYPEDSPENLARVSDEVGYPFPIVYDDTQEVARAFGAVCTPDIFVFDHERKLTYRGQFDGARPSNDVPVTGDDLRAAVEATLAGEEITDQIASIGCGIKWKPGNEPG